MNSFHLFAIIETKKIQKSHLAGSWYPANKKKLEKKLHYYFSLADKYFPINNDSNVTALIVPHAGYHFSGLCAASAYQTIKKSSFDRVIILGPSHNKKFKGISLPNYEIYKTPLGNIPIDKKAVSKLLNQNSLFKIDTDVYQKEHSIEIQLPFLQFCLDNFEILPLIVGNLKEKEFKTVAQSIAKLLNDDKKTLIVISSDFIHYGTRFNYTPPFNDAIKFNKMAIQSILDKSYKTFNEIIKKTKATICGKAPIKILLKLFQMNALGQIKPQLTSSYNSEQIEKSYNGKKIDVSKLSQTSTAKSFVSYAGFVFKSELTQKEELSLLKLARLAITKKLFPDNKIEIDRFIGTDNLTKKSGIFVTLQTKSGKLRGCVGRISSRDPLYKTVSKMALAAAFQDSRFSPLQKKELNDIVLSITVLTPPRLIESYNDIILGKHGIILEKVVGGRKKSAVYLPQVAHEQGWNLSQTLNNLSQKAGLAKDAWRKKGTQFKVFEGFEFSE